MTLEEEVEALNRLLIGKTVAKVFRHQSRTIGIEFSDHTRLFVDHAIDGVECSVTGGDDMEVDRP